jgi:hypothetical protein
LKLNGGEEWNCLEHYIITLNMMNSEITRQFIYSATVLPNITDFLLHLFNLTRLKLNGEEEWNCLEHYIILLY